MNYDEYIQSIIDTRGQWNIPKGEYKEGHHIIPKCLGGEGNPKSKHANIIWLYPKEHYIAHKLLLEKYPDNSNIAFAFSAMAFPKGKTKRETMLTPEEYEEARILYSERVRGANNPMYGKVAPNKGVKMSDEQRRLLSERLKGNGLGKHKSKETILKMKEATKLRDYSKFSHQNKGKVAITDGKITKFIQKEEKLPDGFKYGNINTAGKHDMSNYYSNLDMQRIKKGHSKGSSNPMYGKGYKLAGGNNGKAIYRYHYKDLTFECRKELCEYLKTVFTDISENAIREIQNGTYGVRIKKKFPEIIENLSWELKSRYEDKINQKNNI